MLRYNDTYKSIKEILQSCCCTCIRPDHGAFTSFAGIDLARSLRKHPVQLGHGSSATASALLDAASAAERPSAWRCVQHYTVQAHAAFLKSNMLPL